MTKTAITIPWSVGDKAFYLYAASYSFEVECTFCSYTGLVTLANGGSMKCGVCSGTKTHVRSRPFKFRPKACVIDGFEMKQRGDKNTVEYFLKGGSVFARVKPEDLFPTFYEARKAAQANNLKYGWPKENFDRWEEGGLAAHLVYPNGMYWGRKVRNKGEKE